jgi:two-component system OmpR family sensor kinase
MAVVALVLVGAALVIARATESYLVERVDDQLAAAVPPARNTVAGNRPGRGGGPGGPQGGQGTPSLNALFVGVVDDDGSIRTIATPSLAGDDVPVPSIPASALTSTRDGRQRAFTVGTSPPSDTRYRVLLTTAGRPDAHGDGGATIVVALSLADVDAAVSRLTTVEVLATLLVLGILGLVTFWVIRLGVRPVKQMTATATAIAAGDLSHRVPSVVRGTEAGELGAALNTMLTRIQGAFEQRAESESRLRRFVSDASHELRTPVTTIRGYAELYRGGGLRDAAALEQAMRRTEQEAMRMGTLIDDLLLLARLDEGRPLRRAPVDLGVLVVDAAADARAVAPDRTIRAEPAAGVLVEGDEDRLRQVLANLVNNALVHTPAGTEIVLRAHRDGDATAVVEVADAGPGMSTEDAANAFERFYRADGSRSRASGGSGLGLSIVRAIVEAHHGRVGLHSAPGQGTTVRVELPTSPHGG